MNLSGKYYLPIITADPANPRVMEATNIGFFLMKDCFGRDNLYISGMGGKSILQGPNFIYSNTKLNISDQAFNLDSLDIHNIEEPSLDLMPDLLIDEIEILE